ncbi:MAG TPA: cytosine permease [Fibrobacteria bacterium]|nr:cytosine permease [Fibrobacteria bacterium]
MTNLAGVFGIQLSSGWHTPLALASVGLGTIIAWRGIGAITWTTRLLVPLLLLLGVVVIYVGFRAVPVGVVWNYKPPVAPGTDPLVPYIVSIEANFAFVITLVGGMAAVPRLVRSERAGYWSGVLGQGLSGSLFVVAGAVMAIATKHATGRMVDDPTTMLATLAFPAMALCSLLLVAFANIGTQAVGSYIYGVMLKSAFRKADYRLLILVLAAYVGLLCAWGRIVKYFGSFLTLSACIYAPLAALLVVDFFFVRGRKIALRSAFGLSGHHAYDYTRGINWVGFACVAAGVAMSLAIYNPLTGQVHCKTLFLLTPTGFSFLGTGLLYLCLSRIPAVAGYLLRDRQETTV